jgi:hypothetical protein
LHEVWADTPHFNTPPRHWHPRRVHLTSRRPAQLKSTIADGWD